MAEPTEPTTDDLEPEEGQEGPGDGDTGPRPLHELVNAATYIAPIVGADDKEGVTSVTAFFDGVLDDVGLVSDEADAAITFLEQHGQTVLAGDLRTRQGTAREEQAKREQERLQTDREAAKVALREELAKQRAAEEAKAAEKRRRQELLEEIAQEERAAGGGPSTGSQDVALAALEQAHAIATDLSKSIEERAAAAEAGIEASRVLEGSSPEHPIHIDTTAFLEQVNAELEQRKEQR